MMPAHIREISENTRNRRAAAAAIDRMWATRPLRPPPLPLAAHRATAGALELAREIRAGHYRP